MGSIPFGERRNIWDASPSKSEEERRWGNPEKEGEERCTEMMMDVQKECGQGETQISPHKNKASREYDADDEWQLAIGGKQWDVGNVKIEIWEAATYECVRRGGPPSGIERGKFLNGGIVIFLL